MPHASETFRKHPVQGTFAHVVPTQRFKPAMSFATCSLTGLGTVCFSILKGSRWDLKGFCRKRDTIAGASALPEQRWNDVTQRAWLESLEEAGNCRALHGNTNFSCSLNKRLLCSSFGVNLVLKHWLSCAWLPSSFILKGGICTNIKIGRIT